MQEATFLILTALEVLAAEAARLHANAAAAMVRLNPRLTGGVA